MPAVDGKLDATGAVAMVHQIEATAPVVAL